MPKSRAFKNVDDALKTTEAELSTALKQAQVHIDIVAAFKPLEYEPKLDFLWLSLSAKGLGQNDRKGLKAIINTDALDIVSNFAIRCERSPVSFRSNVGFVSTRLTCSDSGTS